ncbi:MAG: ammonia-forming cytochrome c nitrite reductase [Bacteroidales bacterium]|nr:ammonia-forming cytochrome c nitrite reductase [Bacteroidales bacterium]
MKSFSEQIKEKPWKGWILFIGTVLFVFMLGLLASLIIERRSEAVFAYAPQNNFEGIESDNSKWGKNFPREYESYLETLDTSFRSKHNGSQTIDELQDNPRLVVLWAGYAFSKDYKQGRGHYYAIDDIYNTLRTGAPNDSVKSPMPSTCWTCKSPDVPRMMQKLSKDSANGIAEFYTGNWERWGKEVVNPIGCADCHDAKTMQLTITRPALIEAFERQGKDITKATHQEMRSLVCAQCHVEYYFDKHKHKDANYLTFPWDKGMTVEAAEAYYDSISFSDWTHSLSKTPMIKAQHPDYETFLLGTHAKRGVSCADCHMPYKSQGGVKFTDHHIQSPLNNVANSCQVCHREDAKMLMTDVYERQDKIKENVTILEDLLVKAHVEAKYAWDKGATEEQMKEILQDIRHAQWRWDYSVAAHGASFHASVEISRIVASGINLAHEARLKLSKLHGKMGIDETIAMPDISTKEKAQAYVGLNMDKLRSDKNEFLQKTVPQWKAKN